MKTIDQYVVEVKKIVGIPLDQNHVDFQWEIASIKDAKLQITKIRQIQKELRLVKREIGNEIKMIRADYKVRASNVQAGILSTFIGRRAAGQDRARKRLDVKQKEMATIAPYEKIVRQIDNILVQLDNVKIDIERQSIEKD